eukprot:SAG22_NODE_334_length_12094_cov_9.446019_3_plen_128_part_00
MYWARLDLPVHILTAVQFIQYAAALLRYSGTHQGSFPTSSFSNHPDTIIGTGRPTQAQQRRTQAGSGRIYWARLDLPVHILTAVQFIQYAAALLRSSSAHGGTVLSQASLDNVTNNSTTLQQTCYNF